MRQGVPGAIEGCVPNMVEPLRMAAPWASQKRFHKERAELSLKSVCRWREYECKRVGSGGQ